MSDNRQINDTSVDRREQTTSTQQPGFASTEQVTRDVAAERRQGNELINQILLTILGILEIALGLRLILKVIAANAASGFADFVYGITSPFVAPFTGLVATPTSGGTILEITTIIAMAVYALLFWIILQVIAIAMARPSARSVSRSTTEQTGNPSAGTGTQHTTHSNTVG
jgi:YggT family protein